MKILFKILFALLILSKFSFAQDKLYMMSGGVYDVKVTDTTTNKFAFEMLKSGVTKKITLDREDVYSIVFGGSKEIIFYKQDSLSEDNYMTQAEMSDYIAGQRDAVKGFKSPGTTISSIVVGVASGLGGGFLFPILSPIPPALFVGVAGARWIKIKRKNVSDPKYLKSDTYVMGYDHAARGRRLQNAIIGASSGLVGGILSGFIISSLSKK